MDINNVDSSQSPSKRCKQDTTNVPNDEGLRKLREKLESLRLQLSHAEAVEAMRVELSKRRKETDEKFEQESNRIQLETDCEKMTSEELAEEVENLREDARQARNAQITAEARYLELKNNIRKLMMSNQDETEAQRELKAVQRRIIELKTKFESKLEQLKKSKMQRSNSGEGKAPGRLEELSGKLRDAEKEKQLSENKISDLRRRLDEKKRGEQQMRREERDLGGPSCSQGHNLQGDNVGMKGTETTSKGSSSNEDKPAKNTNVVEISDSDSSDTDDSSSTTSDEESFDSDSTWEDLAGSERTRRVHQKSFGDSAEVERTHQGEQDLRVQVGKRYFVLASSAKFFQLNWSGEFTCAEKNEWSCKKCSWRTNKRERMEDHVFIKHYGGMFKCIECSGTMTKREYIWKHMQLTHPSKD